MDCATTEERKIGGQALRRGGAGGGVRIVRRRLRGGGTGLGSVVALRREIATLLFRNGAALVGNEATSVGFEMA